jgi:hypothetical protein
MSETEEIRCTECLRLLLKVKGDITGIIRCSSCDRDNWVHRCDLCDCGHWHEVIYDDFVQQDCKGIAVGIFHGTRIPPLYDREPNEVALELNPKEKLDPEDVSGITTGNIYPASPWDGGGKVVFNSKGYAVIAIKSKP